MERLRKVEFEGEWWAQAADGSWLRWSRDAATWEQPPTGAPRPPAGNADGMIGGGVPPPSRPIDRWFNRTFPPYSGRRLSFGLVALPVVALVVAMARRVTGGERFSLPTYLFISIVGEMMLVLVWLGPVKKQAARSRLPGGPRPVRPSGKVDRREAIRFSPRGLAIGAVVLFGDLVVFWLVAGVDASLTEAVIVSVPAAAVASLIWQLRRSVFGLILLSALVGLPIGLFLTMFGAFFGNGTTLIEGWLVGSAVALVFGAPYWWEFRRLAHSLPEIPEWVQWTGVSILSLGTAVLLRIG